MRNGLLRLRDESIQGVADRGNVVQGTVMFGANEATCLYLLPDIFAEFQRRYPLVHISIYRNFSHKILQRHRRWHHRCGHRDSAHQGAEHQGAPHLSRPAALHGQHAQSAGATGRRSRWKKLPAQPLIFPRTGFTRQVLDKLFRPYRSRLHITMELPSIGMIKRFVGADAGVSFISESFASDQVKAGEVKLLNVEGVDLWRELGLVYRRDRSLPRAAQSLIAIIREHRKLPEPSAGD